MNVVFIDIDGPILPLRMWAAAENIRLLDEKVIDRSPRLRFDPGCVGLIVRLCDLSDARLVLASNWRRTWAHGLDALHAKIIAEGLRADLWHENWMLPVLNNKTTELASWISSNTIAAGVFIDDEPISTPEPVRMITVSEDEGFGLSAYRSALDIFGVVDPRDKHIKILAGKAHTRTDKSYLKR
jgi:hypothetical protein